MPFTGPLPLAENAGLAFVGERLPPEFVVSARTAGRLLAARNPTGRDNADVVRPVVGAADLVRPCQRWTIAFPPESTAAEAALYVAPFARLRRAVARGGARWWKPPASCAAPRAALARHDRFLASPRAAPQPAFAWIDSPALPDDSLLVVARDDDFTLGILASSAFAVWWRSVHRTGRPVATVASFPFPWPPFTPLSGLTAAQEEHRHALAQAARAGDRGRLDAAVDAAYGWSAGLGGTDRVARLTALNRSRPPPAGARAQNDSGDPRLSSGSSSGEGSGASRAEQQA